MIDVSKLTPAQKQYYEIKQKYKDCIVFFRMGDFYETFYEDAKICSKTLDIALTARHKNTENPIPMAGVPYHSADKYIAKMIENGYKVAVAEQIGEIKTGQIVERDVVNIVTPGTFIDNKDEQNYNFIAAIYFQSEKFHLGWGDFGTGEYWTKSFENIEDLLKFCLKINISELIIDVELPEKEEIQSYIKNFSNTFISIHDLPGDSKIFIKKLLGIQTLSSFGKALENGRAKAIALLFNYLKDTQKTALANISQISYFGDEDKVMLDEITIKNLEILQSSYEMTKKHSLIGVIDHCKTPMGSRLIRSIIVNPIKNLKEIQWRLDNIGYYIENNDINSEIIKLLKNIGDIPRTIGRLMYKKNSPLIRLRLKDNLNEIFNSKNKILKQELSRLGLDKECLDNVDNFYKELDNTLKEEGINEDMNYIKDGYSDKIDKLRQIAFHSDEMLIKYQQNLVKQTGLNNIKIKYINNQGYFIEISRKNCKNFEENINLNDENLDFVRRQTLKSVERYSSTYLRAVESKIISSKEQLQKLEKEVLEKLLEKLQGINYDFINLSNKLAYIDIFTNFAQFAKENNWQKAIIGKNFELQINSGIHPVINKFLTKGENFIPNNLYMNKQSFVHIITGPNMGGKSTFLRQNALIVLLAHCGFWVPAVEAKIPLLDGIFARVGSGDIIAKNQSTFMTEMIEMANILHNANSNSFIILDELGRGTSTYDGMALAREILTYITQKIKAKTLFATHYHELTSLESTIDGIENFSVSVYETDKEVVFLKKIVKGGTSKSYGIDVAKIAGLPKEIINNSKKFLKNLENKYKNIDTTPLSLFETTDFGNQYKEKYQNIKKYLNSLDINKITPIDALGILNKLKENTDNNS